MRNAISDIKVKLNELLDACEAHEKANSMNSEIALVMRASDVEITLSNFAEDLRKKMMAGVLT